jgi:FkbM family methyltransferase
MFNNYLLKTLNRNSINYIDVGARGGIEGSLPPILFEKVNVIGFEPGEKEFRDYEHEAHNKCYSYGLSNKDQVLDFYLNHNVPTSSLYPSNYPYLDQYSKQYNIGRCTKSVLKVECKKLDNILTEIPHLIKIDTQGSEFDILEGAKTLLKKYAPVVIAEAWTKEVYLGAKPVWSIMDFMDSLGYDIFDFNVAAAWGHDTNSRISNYKQKNVGLDLLFVKKFEFLQVTKLNDVEWINLCALLEAYGFRDYAWYLTENISFKSSKEIQLKLEENDRKEAFIIFKILKKICKILKFKKLIHIPRLHY